MCKKVDWSNRNPNEKKYTFAHDFLHAFAWVNETARCLKFSSILSALIFWSENKRKNTHIYTHTYSALTSIKQLIFVHFSFLNSTSALSSRIQSRKIDFQEWNKNVLNCLIITRYLYTNKWAEYGSNWRWYLLIYFTQLFFLSFFMHFKLHSFTFRAHNSCVKISENDALNLFHSEISSCSQLIEICALNVSMMK